MANINEEARIPVYLNDEEAKSALRNLQNEADKWRKKMYEAMSTGNPKGVKEAEREMKKAQKAASLLKKETFDYNKVLKNLSSASVEDLTKTLRKLKQEQKGLNRNSQEYIAIQKKIGAIRGEFRKINGQVTQQNGLMGKLKNAAGGLLPAFGFAAIIGGALALGKQLFNLADQTLKYRQQVQKLTGETGQDLADLTANIEASSKTFKKGFDELAVANHNFAQSMGISEQQANSLINKGFLAGADASGEFLARLREYGPQFKAAGISAEQAIALMTQEVKAGIYSDKGTDAIKEATLAIREMTPATREAIEGIGLSSAKLEADLRSGSISYFEAIQMISRKMAELPPQSTEVGTALADIFKGAGEDAGMDYITMLGGVGSSMDELIAGAGETASAQQKLLDANQRLSKAWSDLLGTGTGTFTAIQASAKVLLADGIVAVVNGIQGIRDWFIELYNESAVVRGYLQYWFAGWKTAISVVKYALQGLWEQLKLGGQLIKAVLTFDLDGIKQAFKDWGTNFKTIAADNAKDIGDAWANAYNETLKGKIEPVKVKVETETSNSNTQSSTTNTSTNSTGSYNKGGMAQAVADAVAIQSQLMAMETEYADFVIDSDKKIVKEFEKVSAERAKAAEKATEDSMAASQELTDFELQQAQKLKDTYLSIAQTMGQQYGALLADSKSTFKDYLRETLLMALDAFHKYFLIQKAKAIIEGITNPLSAIIAIGKVAAMEMAYQGVRAVVAGNIGGGKGYLAGGSTGEGSKYEVAGVVHKKEYVIPSEGTENPALKPFIDIIELARRNNQLARLDLRPIVDVGKKGYSGGGSAGGSGTGGSGTGGAGMIGIEMDPELKELLRQTLRVNSKLEATTEKLHREGTYTRLLGRNGLIETQKDYDRMRREVSL